MGRAVKIGAAALAALTALGWGAAAYYSKTLPDSYYVTSGSRLSLPQELGVEAVYRDTGALSTASREVELRLFGILPIKTAEVRSVDAPVLIPGGTPFGILLRAEGVMVVSLGEVDTVKGLVCPASDAGIEVGDILLEIDGRKITSNSDISKKLSSLGGDSAEVLLCRDGDELRLTITPAYSVNADCYKAGMYVRDSSAGIGTLTFYDPSSGVFGGLGHPVCDVDTGGVMTISAGEAVGVSITGVERGSSGRPGALIGSFLSGKPIGSLDSNEYCGLFGSMERAPTHAAAIPMAMKQEVCEGEAVILSTIEGSEPKAYSVMIERVDYRSGDNVKNLVIRVTDERLLAATGGIVQGMSGSPIIQNGKLAGAVTHVFVGDPTKGYGIFCETMYEAAAA